MARSTIAPLAKRDIEDILAYISAENRSAAAKLMTRIESAILRLEDMPFTGPNVGEHLPKGLRKISIPPYILFYRFIVEDVEVVRVLHASRDISDKLLPRS